MSKYKLYDKFDNESIEKNNTNKLNTLINKKNDDLLLLDSELNDLGILVNDYKYLYENYTNNIKNKNEIEKEDYKKFEDIQMLKYQIEKLINKISNSIMNLNKTTSDEKLQIRNITNIFNDKKKYYEREVKKHKKYIIKLNNQLGKLDTTNKKVVSAHMYLIFVSLLLFFVIIITINSFNDQNINIISIIVTIILTLLIIYYNFNSYI